MKIPQSHLVKLWGVSAARISHMVKAGMPLTSEADAASWKLANQKRQSRTTPILEGGISEKLKESIPEQLTASNSIARKARAGKAEMVAFSLVGSAYNEKNPVALRSAIAGWGEAKKRMFEAEMEHARFEEMTKQTIRVDVVREFITSWFGSIRSLMDAMPSSLSSRANPSDPECAKVAIQEGVDQIFITIQKAEGAFK